MKYRMRIVADKNDIRVLFDNEILFEKIGFGGWYYKHIINNQITYASIPHFDMDYFNIFIGNIVEQLEKGTDRNNLIINIPRKKEVITIGDKIVNIER